MPLVIPPGFAQIAVPFRHASLVREALVTFGVDSSDWAGDYVDMCDRIAADFEAVWSATIDTNVTVGPVKASVGQDGSENLSVEGTYTFQGDLSTDSAPANCAVLVRKLTTRGGRRGRGRFFLPWVCSDGAINEIGVLQAGNVSDINGRGADFLEALALAPGVPMVLLHATGGSATGAPNAVTSLSCDPIIGTQRRRLGR